MDHVGALSLDHFFATPVATASRFTQFTLSAFRLGALSAAQELKSGQSQLSSTPRGFCSFLRLLLFQRQASR